MKNRLHQAGFLFIKGRTRLLALAGVQLLHQAALTTGGVALVDDALAGGFIQILNGEAGRFFSGFRIAASDGGTSFLDEGARAADIGTIVLVTFGGLTDALNSRFVISHNLCAAIEAARSSHKTVLSK